MKKLIKKKRIVIPFRGLIAPFGVSGPVENPYYETLDRINRLIMNAYPVVEVLNDGTRIKLDVRNVDKENGPAGDPAMITVYESDKKTRNKDHLVKNITDEDTEDAKISKLIANSTKTLSSNISGNVEEATVPVEANKVKVNKDDENYSNKKKNKHHQPDSVEYK